MRLSVPGNLLLLGEYAVLEEGGLGLALAIERRVLVDIEEGAELEIEGLGGGSTELWRKRDGDEHSLIARVAAAAESELRDRGRGLPSLRMRVDSRAFFDHEGRKTGMGSSAAVAVGIALVLLRSSVLDGPELEASAFRAALAGHRARQGGRGSGYDIAASLCGGTILFTGGAKPSYARIELPWMRPLRLLRGPAPVGTGEAIRSYAAWKERAQAEARRHLAASNEVVRGFASANGWEEARRRLEEGARLGLALGRAIGVSAEFPGPGIKAVGAGNELGIAWGRAGDGGLPAPSGAEPLEMAAAGPIWFE